MATLGLSKVFILDKYFTELQKFWETEKKLQGKAYTYYFPRDNAITMDSSIGMSYLQNQIQHKNYVMKVKTVFSVLRLNTLHK